MATEQKGCNSCCDRNPVAKPADLSDLPPALLPLHLNALKLAVLSQFWDNNIVDVVQASKALSHGGF